MPWWRFFFWNAFGGIVWAAPVALVAYTFGEAAAEAVNKCGLNGAIAVIVAAAILYLAFRFSKKRLLEKSEI
jgi:membrane protein DedA with SNARE-associated domain